MSPADLPPEGPVLVITDRPARWGAAVADRNAAGHRTALLVAEGEAEDYLELAEQMADEVFRGAPWTLVDARAGIAGEG